MKILDIEKSCTCASFKIDKMELSPGEATTLRIDVDVPTGYMQKFATCVLRTDHPTFNQWAYTVRFISLPFIVPDPDVLSLGSFNAGERSERAIKQATLDVFAGSKVDLTRDSFTVPDELELSISPNPEVRKLQQGVWNTRYKISVGLRGCETFVIRSLGAC